MKPIKPKKASAALGRRLGRIATRTPRELCHLTVGDVQAVIAALEYERQRADEAEKRAISAENELRRTGHFNHWHD